MSNPSCLTKKKSVTFDEKVTNICNDIYVDEKYHEVFVNDEEFSNDVSGKKQLMIVDIGCPRSLMGKKEYRKLLKSLSSSRLERVKEFKACERFRFGPSRAYEALFKVEIPLDLDGVDITAKFFVVDGDVPILI